MLRHGITEGALYEVNLYNKVWFKNRKTSVVSGTASVTTHPNLERSTGHGSYTSDWVLHLTGVNGDIISVKGEEVQSLYKINVVG